MLEFCIGLGFVVAFGIAALLIDAGRDHAMIDNSAEYGRMFEEGLIERKGKKRP
jgi:hypothetical protein